MRICSRSTGSQHGNNSLLDIVEGREGAYRVRLMKNHKDWDCACPGVEVLPDDTVVATSYGHWLEKEQPFIVSVRFKQSETDARLPKGRSGR